MKLLKPKNPLRVLTPFQVAALQVLMHERLLKDFYLTGGTALSAYYLHHRFSDDLDFFTEVPGMVARIPALIGRVARKLHARVTLGRRFETLFECTLLARGERLEMDFALDMPGRLKPVTRDPQSRLALDNSLDIACNKLSALYERAEAKDYADIFFIQRDYLPLPQLIRSARRKYPGLDDYGLSMAFFKVKGIALWPKMIADMDPGALRDFFLKQARSRTKDFSNER